MGFIGKNNGMNLDIIEKSQVTSGIIVNFYANTDEQIKNIENSLGKGLETKTEAQRSQSIYHLKNYLDATIEKYPDIELTSGFMYDKSNGEYLCAFIKDKVSSIFVYECKKGDREPNITHELKNFSEASLNCVESLFYNCKHKVNEFEKTGEIKKGLLETNINSLINDNEVNLAKTIQEYNDKGIENIDSFKEIISYGDLRNAAFRNSDVDLAV